MSRRGFCSSGSATNTNTTAETKLFLLFDGQTRSLTFIFDHHPQIVTILQIAI